MKFIHSKDGLESLLFGAFLILVFAPVRVLYYTYVSKYWLDNIVVVMLVFVAVLYLSKRGKLGYLGELLCKKIQRLKSGKTGFIIATDALAIGCFAFLLFGIFHAEGVESDAYKASIAKILVERGIINHDDLVMLGVDPRDAPGDLSGIASPVDLLLLPLTNYDLYAASVAIADALTNNWLSHFLMIGLVESLAFLCVMLYFRRSGRETGRIVPRA